MVTKRYVEHVAGVAASVFVYAAAPIAEHTDARPSTDASHRKNDADTCNDEGEQGESPTNGVRTLRVGATAGSETSSSADMVVTLRGPIGA